MSLAEMQPWTRSSGLTRQGTESLPKCLQTCAHFLQQTAAPRSDISWHSLIAFLRTLCDSGQAASGRLQVLSSGMASYPMTAGLLAP